MKKKPWILSLNTGSSSLKFCLFEKQLEVLRGEIENIDQNHCLLWTKGAVEIKVKKKIKTHFQAVNDILSICHQIDHVKIDLVAHRFVFGGDKYFKPQRVTACMIKDIQSWSFIAPLHIPQEIKVVKAIETFLPKVTQIACFDTAFHVVLPKIAKTLPFRLKNLGHDIHRYGYHGLSYEFICSYLPKNKKNFIIAHLGSGSSICMIKNRKSIDTTMGLTPLSGIMMGSRPGDVDPGVFLYLLKEKKMSINEIEHLLNFEAGLKGVSDSSSDMKSLLHLQKTSAKAKLAIDMFCYQTAKQIGAYVAILQHVDALVFTGAIGYRSSAIRHKICRWLKSLNIVLDQRKKAKEDGKISSSASFIDVYALETDEEKMLAKHALAFFKDA